MLINENTIEQACLASMQALGREYVYGVTIKATGEYPWCGRVSEVVFREQVLKA